MPSFLASLLVLVSSFVLGGKPVDIPPFLPEEISQRGEEVSNLVKPTPIPTFSVEPDLNDLENAEQPEITKAPAYNNSSEKEIPVDLPEEATNSSPALEAVSDAGVEVNSDLLEESTPEVLYLSDHSAPDIPPSQDPDPGSVGEETPQPTIIENSNQGKKPPFTP